MERSMQSLFPLISRRFQSFSEATDAALDVLADQMPGEILLGQIESGADQLRVLEVRGASIIGIERGNLVPLAHASRDGRSGPDDSVLDGTSGIDDLDASHLKSLGLAEWIALPLEMSDGAVVGIVAALSQRRGDFGSEHVVLLGLTARLLAYEWERVRTRTELRELRLRAGAAQNADPETGLARRDGFLDLLDREWRLARRGTVSSMAVVFQVEAGAEQSGSPLAVLALKDAAEALTGAVRNTDQIGRVGEMELGVAMVGCDDESGVDALADRFAQALRRVTRGRAVEISVRHRWSPLGEAPSAREALEQTEQQLGGEHALASTNGSVR